MDPSEFPAPVTADEASCPNGVRHGAEAAEAILARTRAGESLLAICRSPGMPRATTVCRWLLERPGFAAAMHAARVAAGGPFRGRRALWCPETAQAVLDRVAGGEALSAVCAEAAMPSLGTVYGWARQRPEFRAALDEAYEMRAETWMDRGWELAQAVTPETAYASEVKLRFLRWYVGKVAPKRYGPKKAVAIEGVESAGAGGGRPKTDVFIRTFKLEEGPDGQLRMASYIADPATGGAVREPPRDELDGL